MVELKDNMMRRVIFLFWLSVGYIANAQLTFDFQASQPFLLQVNKNDINVYPCERIVFDVSTSELKCILSTRLLEGAQFEQTITAKAGFKQEFQLGKDKKNNWKWMLVGESEMKLDTALLNAIPSLGVIYSGERRCNTPMETTDFEFMLSECRTIHKSEARLSFIFNKTREVCCSVQQIMDILSLVELEDDKLEVLTELIGRIYDWDERQRIVDSFFTERAQNKVRQLLQ